jgi:hypothetical protein
VVYDAKGRFVVHRITKEEASYKLCKVRRLAVGKGGIPHIGTHDGRTLRYPDPEIKVSGWLLSGGWQPGAAGVPCAVLRSVEGCSAAISGEPGASKPRLIVPPSSPSTLVVAL